MNCTQQLVSYLLFLHHPRFHYQLWAFQKNYYCTTHLMLKMVSPPPSKWGVKILLAVTLLVVTFSTPSCGVLRLGDLFWPRDPPKVVAGPSNVVVVPGPDKSNVLSNIFSSLIRTGTGIVGRVVDQANEILKPIGIQIPNLGGLLTLMGRLVMTTLFEWSPRSPDFIVVIVVAREYYCQRFGILHVICAYKLDVPGYIYYERGLTEAHIIYLITFFNSLRQGLLQGALIVGGGNTLRALRICLLSWSEELQLLAQGIANHGVAQLDSRLVYNTDKFLKVSVSIAIIPGEVKIEALINQALNRWYVEQKSKVPLDDIYNPHGGFDDFAAIVWADTFQVGCGYASFSAGHGALRLNSFVCAFGPAGNIPGSKMFVDKEGVVLKQLERPPVVVVVPPVDKPKHLALHPGFDLDPLVKAGVRVGAHVSDQHINASAGAHVGNLRADAGAGLHAEGVETGPRLSINNDGKHVGVGVDLGILGIPISPDVYFNLSWGAFRASHLTILNPFTRMPVASCWDGIIGCPFLPTCWCRPDPSFPTTPRPFPPITFPPQPITEKRTPEKITDAPTTPQKPTKKPTTERITEKHAMPERITEKPATPERVTEKPTTPERVTEKPATPKPITEKPTTTEKIPEKPSTTEKAPEKPTTENPTTVKIITTQKVTNKRRTTKKPTGNPKPPTKPTEKPTAKPPPPTEAETTSRPTTTAEPKCDPDRLQFGNLTRKFILQQPYIALLSYDPLKCTEKSKALRCTAFFYNSQWLLTSYQCALPTLLRDKGTPTHAPAVVHYGQSLLNATAGVHNRSVVQGSVPKEVNVDQRGLFDNLDSSIALLKLSKPMVYSKYTKAIKIAEKDALYLETTTAVLYGWGVQEGPSPLQVTPHKIETNVQAPEDVIKEFPALDKEFRFVSKLVEKDKSSIAGDVGGPLVVIVFQGNQQAPVPIAEAVALGILPVSNKQRDDAKADKERKLEYFTKTNKWNEWVRKTAGEQDMDWDL